VWRENNILSLLHKLGRPQTVLFTQSQELENLQAIVVTPNEDAVLFITSTSSVTWNGTKSESKISCARIEQNGECLVLGTISSPVGLQYRLEKPAKCDVVIEAHNSTSTEVRVLIAHSNGNFEAKYVNLPGD
jgi:hypothetical protein